jgi:hypothetical protein
MTRAAQQPPPRAPTPLKIRERQAQVRIAPGPRPRKEALKEAMLDGILNARSIALEMLADFRASDRFFKYKAAVVASWLALSLFTVVIACPSAEVGSDNSLDARAWVQKVDALDRKITAIALENQSDEDWGDMLLTLDNSFTAALPGLRARGGKTVVTLENFVGVEGNSPPVDFKPQQLEIRCSRGSVLLELTDGAAPR